MQQSGGQAHRLTGRQAQDNPPRPLPGHALSMSNLPRSRSDDSWIEVSSHPSSASLSSAADEIITTGLRVSQQARDAERTQRQRRRRQLHRAATDYSQHGHGHNPSGINSHDEDEESESESDRVMTSSNEGFAPSPLRESWRPRHPLEGPAGRHPMSSTSSENAFASDEVEDEGDDEDEIATAVGAAPPVDAAFTPQPNAFNYAQHGRSISHQPAASTEPSYFDARPGQQLQRPSTARATSHRHSFSSSQAPRSHSPYNVLSPSHRIDHDAALRASLSTLLSLGAAARGLPKSRPQDPAAILRRQQSNRVDASTLRMVPESVALGTAASSSSSPPAVENAASSSNNKPTPSQPSSRAQHHRSTAEKPKRKSLPPTPRSSSPTPRPSTGGKEDRRSAKKPRRSSTSSSSSAAAAAAAGAGAYYADPTMMTWVLSAGVVVLVSAIGFSAGYVVGREVGRGEAAGLLGAAGGGGGVGVGGGVGTCAVEDAVRSAGAGTGLGLRKLRWAGGGGGGIVA